MATYICKTCKYEWEFVPSDYKYKKSKYPKQCPFCLMPKKQLFKDIYETEGLFSAIKEVIKRIRVKELD